jgi:hypothetical protein
MAKSKKEILRHCATPTPTTVIQRPDAPDDLIHEHVVCPHHGPTGVGIGRFVEIYAIAKHRDDWIALLTRCRVPDCIMNRFNQNCHRDPVPKYPHFTSRGCPTGVSREEWEQMEWDRVGDTGEWTLSPK